MRIMSATGNLEESSESSVREKRRKFTSTVWADFDVLEIDENGRRRAKCKLCGDVYFADSASGTSNLKRHLIKKHSGRENEIESMGLNLVDQEKYREKLAIAIVRHDYPFLFVEHGGNRDLHTFLNPTVEFISRNTARADVLKLFKKEKEKIRKQLDSFSGRICLTSDVWTSITTDGYMSVTAHYVDSDWNLQNKLLIFRHVPPPHSGQVLADVFYEFLKEWGIQMKIFTITVDNAKYNDRVISSLKNYFSCEGSSICENEFLHVRCGAHILNLIVKSGLDVIGEVTYKIRESVKYLKGSEVRLKKFASYAQQLSLMTNKKLTQDVSMRWNSTFIMLERAILFKKPFFRLKLLDEDYRFCPSESEWERVEKIAGFLRPFYDMSTLFSGRKYPTANLYFQNVWKIHLLLNKEEKSEDVLISTMAYKMKTKFLKYWECCSMVLSFAIILDPRYKLQFVDYCFHKLNPETRAEKINDVKRKLFRLFDEYSRFSSFSQHSEDSVGGDVNVSTDPAKDFDSYNSQYGNTVSKSELELYLEERLVDRKQHPNLDVLNYWKDCVVRYPDLSLMARDILSIPITTVASESAFSHGGRILGTYRTSILPENVEAIICSRDWLTENIVTSNNVNQVAQVVNDEEEDDALGVDIEKFISAQDGS